MKKREEEMKKIECIALDVDGTMMDSWQTNYLAGSEAARELTGKGLTEEEFQIYFGMAGIETGRMIYPQNPELYFTVCQRYQDIYTIRLKLFDGIRQLLFDLKDAGYRLAVVTGRTREEYEADFTSFGLDSLFETIICADDTQNSKPDREPMDLLLKRTGLRAEQVLYLGDTLNDSLSTHSAGIPFMLAGWGTDDPGIPAEAMPEQPEKFLEVLRSFEASRE